MRNLKHYRMTESAFQFDRQWMNIRKISEITIFNISKKKKKKKKKHNKKKKTQRKHFKITIQIKAILYIYIYIGDHSCLRP